MVPFSWSTFYGDIIAAKWDALALTEVLIPEFVGSAWNSNTWAAAAAVRIVSLVGAASCSNSCIVTDTVASCSVPVEEVWARLCLAGAAAVHGIEVQVRVVAINNFALLLAGVKIQSESFGDFSSSADARACIAVPDSWLACWIRIS